MRSDNHCVALVKVVVSYKDRDTGEQREAAKWVSAYAYGSVAKALQVQRYGDIIEAEGRLENDFHTRELKAIVFKFTMTPADREHNELEVSDEQ